MGSIWSGSQFYFQGASLCLIRRGKLWLTIRELPEHHGMVEVGRYLWKGSGPPQCPGPHADTCWVSPRTTPQPLWTCASAPSPSQWKRCFLTFRARVACWLLPCHWATLHRAHTAPPSLHPPFSCLYTLMRPALGLLFSRLIIPSCPNIFSWPRCSSPFNTFAGPHLSCTGEGPSTRRCGLTSAQQKGKILSPQPTGNKHFTFFS